MTGRGPSFVNIRILISHVVRDCCARTRPHESFDAVGFGRGEHVASPVHVDIEHTIFLLSPVTAGQLGHESGSVDDYIGFDSADYFVDGGSVGHIT